MKSFEQFITEATYTSRRASIDYVKLLTKLKKTKSKSLQSNLQARLQLLANIMNDADLAKVLARVR